MANTLPAIENLSSADLSGSPLSIYVLIILILRVSGGIKLDEKAGGGGGALLNLCTGRN
jgi:hypothetical protein